MSKYQVIRLENFSGGLHLSRGLTNSYDKSLDTLHSDTLKSALFVCALRLYGPEEVNEEFLKSFLISSAFPFYHNKREGNRCLYFFPRPETSRLPFKIEHGDGSTEKKLKKLRFLEQELFERIIRGEKAISLDENSISGKYASSKEIGIKTLLKQDDCDAITISSPYQHVNIPKGYGADTEPYYVDKQYFHKNAGLYCLIRYEHEEAKKMVEAAFQMLADSGIGTDRNTGNGQFSIGFDEMDLSVPDQKEAKFHLNLSLYCPEKESINEDTLRSSFYKFTKRGGYVSSPADDRHLTIRKRSIYMFTEGSVFPFSESRTGKIENLRPLTYKGFDHPIWRDGRSIFIPFIYEKDN